MTLPRLGMMSEPAPPLDQRLRWLLHTARCIGVEIDTIRVNGDELREFVAEALKCPEYNPRLGDAIRFEGCTLIDDMRVKRIG